MDVELDVEQLQKACRAFPVVAELLKYNLHLSVSALAKEMREKLISFDGNHTRAQAKLCDRIASLEDRANVRGIDFLRLSGQIVHAVLGRHVEV